MSPTKNKLCLSSIVSKNSFKKSKDIENNEMLDLIKKISELKIPIIVIIGGIFLIFIALFLKKAYIKKQHKFFIGLATLGMSLLIFLILLVLNIPWFQNLNYLQTRLYNPQKEENQHAKLDTTQDVIQTLDFNKLNNTLNISDGNTVNLSSLIEKYKAGLGLRLDDDTFSLTSKNSEGTYGSKNKIPQIKVDEQGRILDVTEISLEDSGNGNGEAQILSFDSSTDSLSISDGNEVDLSSLNNNYDGVAGSVFFAGANGTLAENNGNLFWDNNHNRLGLGTTTPDEQLHITQNMRLDHAFEDKDGEAGTVGQVLTSTGTGTDWVDNVAYPIPFISSLTPVTVINGSTNTITITGYNFTPTSAVAISGGNVVNSVNILSPVEMQVNVTAVGIDGSYDIVISNDGVLNTEWTGNGVGLFKVNTSDGTTQATAGISCKHILDDGFSTGDGTYWINPDGGSTANAFQAYCDMTTDGGGWTRIDYAADLPHQAQFSGGDADRWLPNNFTFVLTDTQINNIRSVSTEGKQRYHGTCQGVIHYRYQTNNYAYAFGFRFQNGDETVFDQQNYPSTNIAVPNDGCRINNNTMSSTDFDIADIRVPVINVHSRDNSSTEQFGSPLTSYPAWLR